MCSHTMPSQAASILAYLQEGRSITPKEAEEIFGCMRLAARIRELRENGHLILTNTLKQGKARFAQYRLAHNLTAV